MTDAIPNCRSRIIIPMSRSTSRIATSTTASTTASTTSIHLLHRTLLPASAPLELGGGQLQQRLGVLQVHLTRTATAETPPAAVVTYNPSSTLLRSYRPLVQKFHFRNVRPAPVPLRFPLPTPTHLQSLVEELEYPLVLEVGLGERGGEGMPVRHVRVDLGAEVAPPVALELTDRVAGWRRPSSDTAR